jgi:hypothetical protein
MPLAFGFGWSAFFGIAAVFFYQDRAHAIKQCFQSATVLERLANGWH